MVILCFGDIYASPGRRAIKESLPALVRHFQPDFIVGNVENLAGGRGVNRNTYNEMVSLGFHGFTSGNHIWDNKEVLEILAEDDRLIRPANYPDTESENCPGKGFTYLRSNGKSLYLLNLMGRVFMGPPLDCPFRKADEILARIPSKSHVLVDMHAETTSEKSAMGWYLNGRVSAVIGTHTHVQTSDEQVLSKGTAFITDIGMTGSFDSVIGSEPPEIIQRFITARSLAKKTAEGNLGVGCVVISLSDSGTARSIKRLRFSLKELSEGALEWMPKNN